MLNKRSKTGVNQEKEKIGSFQMPKIGHTFMAIKSISAWKVFPLSKMMEMSFPNNNLNKQLKESNLTKNQTLLPETW